MDNSVFRYIDLFAGMGGIRLGIEQALDKIGCKGECVLTSEIKPHALKVYKDNFGADNIVGDITQIDSKDIPDFDMLLAGFPCQPFSSAGLRRGFADTRGTLFFEIARILKDKQPKFFLLENVENLVIHELSKEDKKQGKKIGRTLETILNVLNELGYKVVWKVLQASDFGVPQIRRRIYIVGSRDNEISLENFKKVACEFKDIQENGLPTIQSDFTEKLFEYLNKNNLPISFLYDKAIRDKRGSSNNIHSWTLGLRGNINKESQDLLEKMVTERRRHDLARKKGVPLKDGVGLDIEEMRTLYKGSQLEVDVRKMLDCKYLKKVKLDTYDKDIYDINGGRLSYEFTKILDPCKPCLTLVATDVKKLGVVDGQGLRQLSLRECLRLHGYPDTYKMDLPYNKAMDLVGNTVVIPVISAICERVLSEWRR